ncbi:hypothetical protein Q7P37_002215 [Cladosporium fusiforme]
MASHKTAISPQNAQWLRSQIWEVIQKQTGLAPPPGVDRTSQKTIISSPAASPPSPSDYQRIEGLSQRASDKFICISDDDNEDIPLATIFARKRQSKSSSGIESLTPSQHGPSVSIPQQQQQQIQQMHDQQAQSHQQEQEPEQCQQQKDRPQDPAPPTADANQRFDFDVTYKIVRAHLAAQTQDGRSVLFANKNISRRLKELHGTANAGDEFWFKQVCEMMDEELARHGLARLPDF